MQANRRGIVRLTNQRAWFSHTRLVSQTLGRTPIAASRRFLFGHAAPWASTPAIVDLLASSSSAASSRSSPRQRHLLREPPLRTSPPPNCVHLLCPLNQPVYCLVYILSPKQCSKFRADMIYCTWFAY